MRCYSFRLSCSSRFPGLLTDMVFIAGLSSIALSAPLVDTSSLFVSCLLRFPEIFPTHGELFHDIWTRKPSIFGLGLDHWTHLVAEHNPGALLLPPALRFRLLDRAVRLLHCAFGCHLNLSGRTGKGADRGIGAESDKQSEFGGASKGYRG